MKKYLIATWGCQMNVHDSEKMAGILAREGYAPALDHRDADLIIFNTCSIREKAEQKFFSELGKLKSLKKSRPDLRVAVAGCVAQQMGEGLRARAPHVDFIVGPQNLHRIPDMDGDARRASAIEDNPSLHVDELPALRTDRGRAWVSIMYGCDNFCSYCIVPYTRGRERSRPSESIIREIEGLASEGVREVTLLGQNVNSYRSDTDFPGLLRKIDAVEGIERVRFVTSHPKDFSDALIDAMAELPSVCQHIHLPLQSGSSRILGLMNRRYAYEEYADKVRRLRERIPDIAITSDIISGFPTETASDHEATLRALEEISFDGIFAFRFSARPGTRAEAMEGQLPEEVKLERLREILALQDGITLGKNKSLEGTEQEVLVEGPSDTDPSKLTGRTRTNKIVNFSGNARQGELARVQITLARRHSLEGSQGAQR
jgi:tRNA-2-methylthio-N6-dimethylallyladenosine synthase